MTSGSPHSAEPINVANSDFRLGIDFGTSHTTAVLRWPDGHTRPILFDGSPLLPSAVYADPDGQLLVGRDAIHAARLDPARFEPTPKRHIGTGEPATTGKTTTDKVAAVLERVREEAERVSGVSIGGIGVSLTHPAGWDADRIDVLRQAGRQAGLGEVRLVPEPVAAAGYFVTVLGGSIPAGSALVVYDFGAGTFDASVVIPTYGGYEVLALAGLDDVGGVDLDLALLQYVADTHRDADPAAWQRLAEPETAADRRHVRHLTEDVRAAKEMLSRAESATVPVPLLELEARITRAEFDELARPFLDRTVATTVDVIGDAGRPVAAVLLVGGSSRIPLVKELLERGTGIAPSTIDQPETVVAEGSLQLATGPATKPTTEPTTEVNPVLGLPVDPWASGERLTRPVLTSIVAAGPMRPTQVAPRPERPRPTLPQPATVPRQVPRPGPPRYEPPTQDRRHTQPPDRSAGPTSYRQYQTRTRRRWPIAVTAVIGVLAIAAGVVVALPYLRGSGHADPAASNGAAFNGTSTAASQAAAPQTAGTQPTATSAAPTTRPPYQRTDPPAWLPSDWRKLADDEQRATVTAGPATNGGTCRYVSPGVLRVTRDSTNVSGCVSAPGVRDNVVRNVAVEATFAVITGCGGMWVRTGARGYFVAVCADGTVQLHELANDPPSDATLIGGPWRPGFDVHTVVVGLLAQDAGLMVVVDGQRQPIVLDDSIGSGRVGVGGFAPGNAVDATISRFRVWTPTGSGG